VITAVDTSVLLDIFTDDATFVRASSGALRECMASGALIGCDVVWAELGGTFDSTGRAAAALARLGVRFVPMDASAALEAGHMWREYRRRGGTRRRMIADFLIGAHAQVHADRLLTRDRGFYATYFADLRVFDPSS
jgi:predicted nucleic acid-binding protein